MYTHIWYWNPRLPGEKNRKNMKCRVLLTAKKNSVLVELEDGEKVVTSRYAVRRISTDSIELPFERREFRARLERDKDPIK